MSYTPFNAPILSGLLGDPEIAAQFSVKAEIAAILRFEQALAESEAEAGVIPAAAASAIAEAIKDFEPLLPPLTAATARDGTLMPELLRQLRQRIGESHQKHLHFGATSQDAIDTSLVLRLRPICETLLHRLSAIDARLAALLKQFGENALMGRTRMQAALPISVADRLGKWRRPIGDLDQRAEALSPKLFRLQFGGPVGRLDAFGEKGAAVVAGLAARLDLAPAEHSWHAERGAIAEFAGWLSLITGHLGSIGIDIALMAQNEFDEVRLAETGGSSSMAHKRNPVRAEALVTLARFNAGQLAALHQALVHEQERSGAAWMLEWMVLPALCVAAGAATRNAGELLDAVTALGRPQG